MAWSAASRAAALLARQRGIGAKSRWNRKNLYVELHRELKMERSYASSLAARGHKRTAYDAYKVKRIVRLMKTLKRGGFASTKIVGATKTVRGERGSRIKVGIGYKTGINWSGFSRAAKRRGL